jgi:phosphopantetheine adenylyltransferase
MLSPKVHMIHRAQKIFPSLKITVSLESSKHIQSTANQRKTADLLLQN